MVPQGGMRRPSLGTIHGPSARPHRQSDRLVARDSSGPARGVEGCDKLGAKESTSHYFFAPPSKTSPPPPAVPDTASNWPLAATTTSSTLLAHYTLFNLASACRPKSAPRTRIPAHRRCWSRGKMSTRRTELLRGSTRRAMPWFSRYVLPQTHSSMTASNLGYVGTPNELIAGAGNGVVGPLWRDLYSQV